MRRAAARQPGMTRWAWAVPAVVLLGAPLAFLPADTLLAGAFETPRRLLLALGGGGLLALALWRWAREGRIPRQPRLLDGAVALCAAGALLSGAMSAYPHVSWLGALWNDDALPLPAVMLALYLGLRAWVRGPEEAGRALALLVIAGGLVAALGLLDHTLNLHLGPAFSTRRLVGTLGNPMFTDTYLALLVPPALCLALAASRAGECSRGGRVEGSILTAASVALVAGLTRRRRRPPIYLTSV